ncbi:MAG: 1-acyl-sn-glycerol-3-phosphate acyltransferase [bacterium]|nr:1-acyl-sn-glycerol-3-phosphate acyltransferase [bacterium]
MKVLKRLPARIGYVFSCLLAVFTVVFFFIVPKARGKIREICLDGQFTWNKGSRLYVTNHPSWLDQFLSLTLRLLHWSPEYLPFVAVANDSIGRIPFLKFLQEIAFVVPIERNGNVSVASHHIKKMVGILKGGHNLMIAGAAGRDFKAADGEVIYSPQKGKPMRRFTELSGFLATQAGVETIPLCIQGTEKFYKEVMVGGKKEMKFSAWNFFVKFWLLGKLNVVLVYGEPLVLAGRSRSEATEIIQSKVLHYLDLPEG